MRPTDVALSFLPLAHVYERIAGLRVSLSRRNRRVCGANGGGAAGAPGSSSGCARRCRASSKKFTQTLSSRDITQRESKGRIFDWAMRVARKAVPWKAYGKGASPGLRLQWYIANTLVYSKIRAGLGGRKSSLPREARRSRPNRRNSSGGWACRCTRARLDGDVTGDVSQHRSRTESGQWGSRFPTSR